MLAPGFEVEIGELSSPSSERLEAIAPRFRAAGADATIRADILDAMWEKWVFNASIGAATSLMRAPVGEIVAAPGGAAFARAVLSEAAATAAVEHHPVSSTSLGATERALTSPGSPATSSLSRDLLADRPAEVEPVLGDLVAKAEATGTPAPLLALTTLALRIHNNRFATACRSSHPEQGAKS